MQLAPNALLQGRYRVQSLIAQGGMGAVYRAVDERLGSTVALKQTLMRDPQLRAAFEREARLLAGLQHPALPVVSDHFAEGDGQFLVMQFIPGNDLATMLAARGGHFALDEVLPWADQLLDALDYLHTQRPPIIHRDLKPQNLKLTPRGEIVLLDFGLAKGQLGGGATGAPSLFGYTPQYAPIEQIQGAGTDPRSDIYAFGATLYQLLTGQAPPDALARAAATVSGQPDPLRPAHELNRQLPAALGQLLQRAMAQAPSQRPPSAAALRQELRQAADGVTDAQTVIAAGSAGQPTIALARPAATPAAQPHRPTRWPMIGAAIALSAVALTVAVFLLLQMLLPPQVADTGAGPQPGAAPQATVVLVAATAGPAAPEAGSSRANPLPISATAQNTNWAILVTGVTRGDPAWNLLYETNSLVDPPPDGWEYVVVHLRVRALAGSDARQTLYPELTGDRLVAYRPAAAVTPHERPDEYAAGDEYDVDFPYLVEVGEGNLIFALDDIGSIGDAPVFIALDEGAAISVADELVTIKPTNLGADPREPAQLGDTVTTEDYQVTIHEIVRGDAAYQRLLEANLYNDPPSEGGEYLLLLAEVRSIQPKDETVMVSDSDFYSVDADAADLDASAITFISVVEPEPAPPFYLYPGGRAMGWVTVEIRKDAPNARIVFGPSIAMNDLNTRYFAIE